MIPTDEIRDIYIDCPKAYATRVLHETSGVEDDIGGAMQKLLLRSFRLGI